MSRTRYRILACAMLLITGCASGPSSRSGGGLWSDVPLPPLTSSTVEHGEKHLFEGDPRAAKDAFERAIQRNSKDARAYFDLGLAMEMLDRPAHAERAYRAAIALWDPFAQAQHNLAWLLRRRGAAGEAVQLLRKSAQDHRDSASAQANLAMALVGVGDMEAARRSYERSLELDPNGLMAQLSYGVLLVRLGERERGATYLKRARIAAEGNRPALLAVAQALRQAGDGQQAVTAVRAAMDVDSDNVTPALWCELALAQQTTGDRAAAEASLQAALKLASDYAPTHYVLGALYDRDKAYAAAEKHYQRYLELAPRGLHAAHARQQLNTIIGQK